MCDTADERAAWLSLVHRPGLGRAAQRRLLAALGSPQAVLAADPALWRELAGAAGAAALAEPSTDQALRLQAVEAWLAAAPRRRLLTLADADYPPLLLQTADPPLLLYLEGRAELLAAPASLAVVGSRHPTPQGADNARALAAELSRRGWTIVSGLAAGIDGAAHRGALEGAGSTVAVVGTGLDIAYPRSHRALMRQIAEQGLLLSEFALGTPPLPLHFPLRNRIIAGLAQGTLVVEAALQSGSLITARLAAEAGREVFAVPGSIHSPQARGCHELLRQGAKLVESAADVLQEFERVPARAAVAADFAAPSVEPEPEDPVLRALGHDPATLDVLIARCGWAAPTLQARLLELELDGRVARLPGGLYQRRMAG